MQKTPSNEKQFNIKKPQFPKEHRKKFAENSQNWYQQFHQERTGLQPLKTRHNAQNVWTQRSLHPKYQSKPQL